MFVCVIIRAVLGRVVMFSLLAVYVPPKISVFEFAIIYIESSGYSLCLSFNAFNLLILRITDTDIIIRNDTVIEKYVHTYRHI